MNPRIQQFASKFNEYGIDAYLVTKEINITYLTGFPTKDSWLLVFPKKVFYITDSRYTEEARKYLHGIRVRRSTSSQIAILLELINAQKAKSIGFDERHVSLDLFKQIRKASPSRIRWIRKNNAVEDQREIKDREEIRTIRECIRLNLEAYRYLKGVVKPGLTENDILLRLERFVRGHGARFSFDPIIASGPHSCFPHAKITDRRVKANDVVMVDMGIDLKGYKSDLTRMFFLGRIPSLVKEVTKHVATAQRKAIEHIRPGVTAEAVDQEARNYLKEQKLSKFFGHSLGHGVGLEIHERPRISQNNSIVLKKGMIFTVEPAVYIPQKFGIRIEDMVLVTPDGCEVLSRRGKI